MTIQENPKIKTATRNERWAIGLMYGHTIAIGLLFIGGLIDSFLKKSESPFFTLACVESVPAMGSIINVAQRYSQKGKISVK